MEAKKNRYRTGMQKNTSRREEDEKKEGVKRVKRERRKESDSEKSSYREGRALANHH